MASRFSFLQGLQAFRAKATHFNPAVNLLFKQVSPACCARST